MSLASPYQEHYYIADGETTRFSFGEYFSAPTSANVKCIIYFEDGTSSAPTFTVDITTGYIDITALTTPDGQVLNAPPAGSSVRVFRDTPEQQNVTASQLQNYTAKQLEKVFDSIVAMIQEVSYSDKHKTLRLTETQRDVFLAFLKEANDDALLYWDNNARTVVPTDFVRQDVVRMSGGLFFRMKHDSQLRPYLEWSINGQTDWNSLNWQIAKDVADEAKEIAQEAKEIAQNAKDVADDAKDVADEAKEIAEGIDGKAQQALDNSVEALEVAEEAKEMIQDQIIVRSVTIPTASADLAGKVYQYSGTTNGVYTHNYIYECQETETNSYGWVRVDVQPDRIAEIQALQADVTDIQALIPAQASPANQLGDKNFINSSIATNTANFIGTFNSVAELEAYSGTVTNNDYAFVIGADSAGNTTYNRYKYNANTQQWIYEYTLNNSSFTADQWTTINSGVTASDVSKARSAVQPSDVGNGTITITQGGETKGSFTTNQGNNTTINLDSGAGGSGLNVGDVFFTMRNDNELNGAVECDGATYNTTDFTGAQSIGALLEAGKIDYISLAAYSTAISTKGWCDKIGWNGTGNTAFRVPTLNAHIVQTNNIPVIGNGKVLGLTNGTDTGSLTSDNNASYNPLMSNSVGINVGSSTTEAAWTDGKAIGVVTDATKSGIIADTSDTAQSRVMIQLAVAASDEALETCTGVLADVADLKDHRVIAFQAPTAANNYTWYRKYADGWVEQGGTVTISAQGANSGLDTTVNLPVTMADANYHVAPLTFVTDGGMTTGLRNHKMTRTTTQLKIGTFSTTAISNSYLGQWEVKGKAAS